METSEEGTLMEHGLEKQYSMKKGAKHNHGVNIGLMDHMMQM